MDVNDSLNYDELKIAILRKYDINRETYRQQFRSLDVEPSESPKELYVRLKELYGKWMQPKSKSVEEVGEVIIMEQYLRMLSPELQVWVREHDPQTASQAATLADVFVAARRGSQPWCWKSSRDDRKSTFSRPVIRNIPNAGTVYAPQQKRKGSPQ
ncbi:zinc finger and SCAN domain-containing protein 16-like [Puntigrus tetrazona]|uniref:zinc finger and SCAN domain-containing protein 16-like n=1 Tax=Puntigrus tetrazona TaxID=1606681 RepID=UPI001C8A0A45|nr:zinc finger and SCAN domain-containing protein 16-like [Puntigrus tetrazona]